MIPPILKRTQDEPAIPPLAKPLPEGEAIIADQIPFDDTPNSPREDPSPRIPHLGHALLFFAITFFLLFGSMAILLAVLPARTATPKVTALVTNPRLILAAEALSYIATLVISIFLYPRLWRPTFFTGISWNFPAARRNALKLIPLGLVLGWTVQAISSLISIPKSLPMDDFFRTPTDVWLVTAFGILLAPLFEEICFRGFLVPAFAIAYDWISLPRSREAHALWKTTRNLSTPSVIFSSILASIFFALLHGNQIAFVWPVLIILFTVSLILSAVRLRLRSVAASTLVHASYNFTIFLTAFIATGGYRHLERMAR